jgi:hypothetical protein
MVEIPVIITDTESNMISKDHVAFIEECQVHKSHVFLPVTPGCYTRVKVPLFSQVTPSAFILTHDRGQHPSLQAIDSCDIDFIKKMTIGRYAIARAIADKPSKSKRRRQPMKPKKSRFCGS